MGGVLRRVWICFIALFASAPMLSARTMTFTVPALHLTVWDSSVWSFACTFSNVSQGNQVQTVHVTAEDGSGDVLSTNHPASATLLGPYNCTLAQRQACTIMFTHG